MVTPEEIREQAKVFAQENDSWTAKFLRDLAAQVEALQADAERYRWLRDSAAANLWYEKNWARYDEPTEFDAYADAARKDQP